MGDMSQCAELARHWVEAYPRDHKPRQLLGISRLNEGAAAEAVEILRQACQINGNDWSLWDNLAVALQHSGRHEEASKAFRRSLQLAPGKASVWSNASANQLQMGSAHEALRLAKRATTLAPNLAEAHLNLGNALSQLGRSDEALRAFKDALRLKPRFVQALLSLGVEYSVRGKLTEARAVTSQALAIQPQFVDGHINLGGFLSHLGDIAAAGEHFRTAREIDPSKIAAWSGALYCTLHDARLSAAEIFAEHAAFMRYMDAARPQTPRPHDNTPTPDRRLRLGFVSGDLRNHPVARAIEPIWRHLDRAEVEIFAYDNHPGTDDTAARLKALADRWVVVAAFTDETLAERIRNDRIDILFDLSGHTAYNRLGAFVRKPAPIQVSWLGYPGTTGLSAMDYRLVDAVSAPPAVMTAQFTEKLAYLPQSIILEQPGDLPALAEPPMLGNEHVTFGSFQRLNKLSDDVIATWSQVLTRTPSSRLLIGAVPNQDAEAELLGRFQRHGVAETRLLIRHQTDMKDYLALHNEVDILLDTWPFSSGTTASLALWMGVPTITLAGATMAQRLCAARLAPLGLDGFIAEDKDRYLDLTEAWSRRPNDLTRLRNGLRADLAANTTADATKLTRALESRLRQMWRRWCRGLAPEPLT